MSHRQYQIGALIFDWVVPSTVHADICCTVIFSVSPHVLHRGAVASLVGIWAMMVVAGELEEKCASFEQYLATQVPQSRGNVLKSLTTVSCMSESMCTGRVSRKLN